MSIYSSQRQRDEGVGSLFCALPSRRAFLWSGVAAAAGFAMLPRAAFGADSGGEVTIIGFGPDGRPTGKQKLPRISKPDAEWQQQLSPIAFQVTRHAATERPFTVEGWDEHGKGLFRCVCCDTALFSSETKFDSGTGWPSFWKPLAKENIVEKTDGSLGMMRTAVSCRLCEAHLGHVFDDGPRPTGLRYCMNAAALHFVKMA